MTICNGMCNLEGVVNGKALFKIHWKGDRVSDMKYVGIVVMIFFHDDKDEDDDHHQYTFCVSC
jgi:hypothetical protein